MLNRQVQTKSSKVEKIVDLHHEISASQSSEWNYTFSPTKSAIRRVRLSTVVINKEYLTSTIDMLNVEQSFASSPEEKSHDTSSHS